MIIIANGKKLVFEMQWKAMLSQVHVHKEASAAKSQFLWHGENKVYYGLIGKADQGTKLKGPLYSAAIALMHLHPHTQNMLLILNVPEGDGYVACGIYQGRPYDGLDVFLQDDTTVQFLIETFRGLCGLDQYTIFGDANIEGIAELSLDQFAAAADEHALLKKVKSHLVNPVVMLASLACVGMVAVFGYQAYVKHRNAELQRKALETQQNSQQLYDAEIAARRLDVTLPARSASGMLGPLRKMKLSRGGWNLDKITCNVAQTKQMACGLIFLRGRHRQATNKTFLDAAGNDFLTIVFGAEKIDATLTIAALDFATVGAAIDSAVDTRRNQIELGSLLQEYSNLGKQTLAPFEPFAIPPGANTAELTKPPTLAGVWEFSGPLGSLALLRRFPDSATITQIEIKVTDKPIYEVERSFATFKVAGKVFAKPS